MKLMISCAVAIAFVGVASLTGIGSATDKSAKSAALNFLAGSWHAAKWGGDFHAYYSTAEGGKVLSHSKLLREGKVAFYEFEVFEVLDGKLTATPHPGGKPAARFTASSVKKHEVVFDNPDKDFPTRITYAMVSKDLLRITLADPHNDSTKTDVFELKRVKPTKKK